MTLRVLLQKIHRAAAILGADAEIHIAGFQDTRFVQDLCIQKTAKSQRAVLAIGREPLKRPKRTEAGHQKNRINSNSRYAMLRELGICYTCKGELLDSPTAQCPSCREKMNRRHRV